MRIEYLRNHPACQFALAELCAAEWQHLYEDWNCEAAWQEYEFQRAYGSLPLTLVALEGAELLGAVSLIFDDLPGYEHLHPWLASLMVVPGHRGKGTGCRLVREAEKLLAKNGVQMAYLFTESARPFFAKLGWQALEETFCNGHPVFVLQKRIEPSR